MRVGILGSLELRVEGVTVRLRSERQRIAMVLLALTPDEVLSTDRLADAIWPDDPPDDVDRAVHTLVYRLRQRIAASAPGEKSRILCREPGYVLSVEPHQVDAIEFTTLVERSLDHFDADPVVAERDLRRALALWRGEPLIDAAYVSGIAAEIRRLNELRLGAVEALTALDIARGHTGRVIAELESLTASFPLRETLWVLLWQALVKAHRTTEVAASFRRVEQILDEEYSLGPSAELRELATDLAR